MNGLTTASDDIRNIPFFGEPITNEENHVPNISDSDVVETNQMVATIEERCARLVSKYGSYFAQENPETGELYSIETVSGMVKEALLEIEEQKVNIESMSLPLGICEVEREELLKCKKLMLRDLHWVREEAQGNVGVVAFLERMTERKYTEDLKAFYLASWCDGVREFRIYRNMDLHNEGRVAQAFMCWIYNSLAFSKKIFTKYSKRPRGQGVTSTVVEYEHITPIENSSRYSYFARLPQCRTLSIGDKGLERTDYLRYGLSLVKIVRQLRELGLVCFDLSIENLRTDENNNILLHSLELVAFANTYSDIRQGTLRHPKQFISTEKGLVQNQYALFPLTLTLYELKYGNQYRVEYNRLATQLENSTTSTASIVANIVSRRQFEAWAEEWLSYCGRSKDMFDQAIYQIYQASQYEDEKQAQEQAFNCGVNILEDLNKGVYS